MADSKPRRVGTITKRGKDRYLVRVFVGRDSKGKRQYINQTVRGKKGDADAVLTDLLGKRQSGTLAVRPRVVLDDFLATWLEEKAIKRKARTLHTYRQVLDLYVRPHLGALHLTQIDEQAICGMLSKLRKQGLGPRSIRKAHEVLRNALQSATNKKLIPSNPAKSEAVLEVLPEKPSTERTTVPVEKMRDVVEAASNDRLAAYWMVLLFGGLRPSEALALRWEDYRNKAVTIRRTLVDKNGLPLAFETPKTKKSVREVVLPDVAVKALQAHRDAQAADELIAREAWQGQDLIFCNEIGEPLRQDQTRDSFARILKAAGLRHMRIYDLRHSCATLLLEMGENLKVVSDRLGHSTIVLTADTYMHGNRQQQEASASRFDGVLG